MAVSEKSISVLIADDHDLLVEMVEACLESEGFKDNNRARSLDEALEKIANEGSFDIVLLDLDMPGMNGLQGIEKAIAANKDGAVVLFSGQARQEAVFRALEMGARGYVPKTLTAKSMTNALKFIASGEVFVPSVVASSMAQGQRSRRPSTLTAKEMDVLRGICRGDANKDIARDLGLTEITVKMHVRSICAKLNVSNRTQIAMTAVARGLF